MKHPFLQWMGNHCKEFHKGGNVPITLQSRNVFAIIPKGRWLSILAAKGVGFCMPLIKVYK